MTIFHQGNGEVQKSYMKIYFVGLDFIDTYDMKLIAGHDVSDDYVFRNTFSYIINRAALSRFGIQSNHPEKAIGKKMTEFGVDGSK